MFVTGDADFSWTSSSRHLSAALPPSPSLEPRSLGRRTMPFMWPHDFAPCQDLSAAEWIGPRLLPWGTEMGTPVTSVVPTGFDAYVRVFHPAGAPAPFETVTWREVAHWSGRKFHPLAQFERLSVPARSLWGPPPFEQAPFKGTLTSEVCELLVRQLAGLTGTPSACYFALWEGWGVLGGGWSGLKAIHHSDDGPDAIEAEVAEFQRQVALLPRFEHPHRSTCRSRTDWGSLVTCTASPLALTPGRGQYSRRSCGGRRTGLVGRARSTSTAPSSRP